MEKAGLTVTLSRLLRPLLHRIFPGTKKDPILSGCLSANICANFLGLGNAATPMGIRAVQRMADPRHPGMATDQMCRLIVLNTASIQLIPANVAAVRASLGSGAPFDILPAVWVTSLCSASLGLCAAWLLGKVCRHD
jgi:spore maturation protein A